MALRPLGSARALAPAAFPVLVALAMLAVSRPAVAQITTLEEAPVEVESEEPLPFVVVGLVGIGSFNTYAMERLNKAIEIMNTDITQPGVRYDPFGKGASLGLGLRAIFGERLMVDATWERVLGKQEIGGTTAKSTLEAEADSYLFTVGWDLMKKRRAAFGPAVGIGYYDARGRQLVTETPVDQEPNTVGTLRMSGSKIGMHVGAYFESAIAGRVWMNAFAGYRNAHVDALEITGLPAMVDSLAAQRLPQTRSIAVPVATCERCADLDENGVPDAVPDDAVVTLQGGGNSLDWSGFVGRLALTWYFNTPVE